MADDDSRAGRRYSTQAILDFTNKVHTPHDAGLARAFATPEGVPAIMVSPSDGRLSRGSPDRVRDRADRMRDRGE